MRRQIDALMLEIPGTRVHADLAAFAQDLIHNERRERGMANEEPDSLFGKLS